ncbi:MAG: hypothetical protein LBS91_02605 [Clostridiales Family XIII bacterium]|jgi:hypothetical protein|nr:hypothetical protein [Clostridiales Family XIII bacterium]
MKRSKRAGAIIGVIMFAIVISGLYAIIYAAPRIEGIGIKTEVVGYESLPIADTVTALFVRDETLYTAAYSGKIDYMIAAGTKVRAGSQVMYIEPGAGGAGGAPEAFEAILRAAGGGAAASEGGVSPTTAIVSYLGDGWEKKVTPDNVLSLPKGIFEEAPGEAVDLTREWAQAGEPVYRITNNNLWRVAFWIENADKTVLDKYKIGKSLLLDLGTTKVRATVETAEPRGKDIFVVLKSDIYYKELDKYRKREIDVVFSEVSGAVINKQSVKLKLGQPGVYVKQQSGTFKWVPVNVQKESGGRYLVSETRFDDKDGKSMSTIRYYDEIMSDPAEEGY